MYLSIYLSLSLSLYIYIYMYIYIYIYSHGLRSSAGPRPGPSFDAEPGMFIVAACGERVSSGCASRARGRHS